MVQQAQQFYDFAAFRLDVIKRLLMHRGEIVPLMPKAFDTLLALVESEGNVVEKEELMKRVWPNSFVEEGNLTNNISVLRKALGERAGEHQYIVTVPGRGYKFVATVKHVRDVGGESRFEERPVSRIAPAGGGLQAAAGESEPGPRISKGESLASAIKKHKRAALILLTALAMAIIAGSISLNTLREPEQGERISIAVVDFSNETGEEDLNGLSGMLITSLEQSRRLSVLTRSRMFDILKQIGDEHPDRIDESLGRQICQRANISVLAIASIRKFDQLYAIDLKVVDLQENEYLFTASEKGEGKANVPGMIDRLSERTRVGLREKAAEVYAFKQKVADTLTPNLEAYRHYFLGEQLSSELNWEKAKGEFKAALALDPAFAVAYYQLARAELWNNKEKAREPIGKAMQHVEKAPGKYRSLIRALNAEIEGDRDRAISQYKEVLNSYPMDKEALWMMGDLSYHKYDLEMAKSYLENVLAIDPSFEPALIHIVWVFEDLEQYDEMSKHAKLFAQRSAKPVAYRLLASACTLRGDFAGAIQTYQRAHELFRESSLPAEGIAKIHIIKNEYPEAEAEFRNLLHRSRSLPEQLKANRGLALVYAYTGRYRQAVGLLDKSVGMDSKPAVPHERAFDYITKAYYLAVSRGDRRETSKAIERAVELGGHSHFWFDHALFFTYLAMGEYEKAYSLSEGELQPYFSLSDIARGYTHKARGEYIEAISSFRKATERGYLNDRILTNYELAECYLETGQNEKAAEALERMQRSRSDVVSRSQFDFGHRAAVYPRSFYLLGKVYEQRGNRKFAVENYEKFLALWREADRELPELLDAKSRLAKLKAMIRGDKVSTKWRAQGFMRLKGASKNG